MNFTNVTVTDSTKTAANTTIATVSNGSATVGLNNATLDGGITGTTAFNMTTAGTSRINGNVTNANITNTGTLTAVAGMIGSSDLTNSGTVNLSGNLAKNIAGNGTTKVNQTLTLNNGAAVAGTLNLNNGTVTLSAGSTTSHNVGTLSGNGNLNIDLSLANAQADVINASNASSGTVTLASVNILIKTSMLRY